MTTEADIRSLPYGWYKKWQPNTLEWEAGLGAYAIGQDEYHTARYEHAWLLRAEGLKLKQIGNRLGCSNERARQMINQFGRKMSWAMRDVSWSTK